jgi:hypothetical protein
MAFAVTVAFIREQPYKPIVNRDQSPVGRPRPASASTCMGESRFDSLQDARADLCHANKFRGNNYERFVR